MKWEFYRDEVIGFLEWLILHQEAGNDEMEMYEDMIWNECDISKLNKYKNIYKKLKKKMRKIYDEGV